MPEPRLGYARYFPFKKARQFPYTLGPILASFYGMQNGTQTHLGYPIYLITPENSRAHGLELDWLWASDPTGKPAMRDAPERLWVHGSERALGLLNALPSQGFGVVGTREPELRSRALTKKSIQALTGEDLIVVSGFARGIDAEAHAAALSAGLATVAFLGAGLLQDYPRPNALLREQILRADSLLVSEYPLDESPKASYFHPRNRLIAAFSKAVWIVEAAHTSGAMNTAYWAQRFERDLYATPHFPGDFRFAGNEQLLAQEKAWAFWNAGSLGATWLGLSGKGMFLRRERPARRAAGETDLLVSHVEVMTGRLGGVEIRELLEWGLSQGWSPAQFFERYQGALMSKQILDKNGLILKGLD